MVSDSDYLYEQGLTDGPGGLPLFCFKRYKERRDETPKKGMSLVEAINYAKQNPGEVLKVSEDTFDHNLAYVITRGSSRYFYK